LDLSNPSTYLYSFMNLSLLLSARLPSKMGRKRTAEERRGDAEDNVFNDDGTAADDNPILRDILDYTKERYDIQTELWFG
jgi:hypothetical protein